MMFHTISTALQLPTSRIKTIALFGLAAFFINVGIDHFVNPDFYLNIMPDYLPLHLEAVYISGFFEVLGGICVLIPRLRAAAGWGLVALLIAGLPREYSYGPESRLISRDCREPAVYPSAISVYFYLLGIQCNSPVCL